MSPPRIAFVVFAATTAAAAQPGSGSDKPIRIHTDKSIECKDGEEVTQTCKCAATDCDIGQTCNAEKCEGDATHSSAFIGIKYSMGEASTVFSKVLHSKIEDSEAKGLQDYARALDVKNYKAERIPLLDPEPDMSTKLVDGKRSDYPKLTVYTDNDDTVKCSGSENADSLFSQKVAAVAGSDQSCIHGSFYAGVAQLYHELSTNGEDGEHGSDGKVFMVSASPMPHHYPENTSMSKLVNPNGYFEGSALLSFAGATHNFNLFGSLLGGGPLQFSSWLLAAIVKANKIHSEVEKTAALKKNIVWFGDDGQGDALTAVLVANIARVSFIHRVSEDTSNQVWMNEKQEPVYLKDHVKDVKNVVYFNTHPEAAELAKGLQLITEEAAMRVHKATITSALGKACCQFEQCDIDSAENKLDNTCGTGNNDDLYDDESPELQWDSKYCAPVKDAWGFYTSLYFATDKTRVTCKN